MATIAAIITILIGLMIVLVKAIGSGVQKSYNYTKEKVAKPINFVREVAGDGGEAVSNSRPIQSLKDKTNKAELAARMMIDAVRQLKDD